MAVLSHATIFNQSECFIQHSYAILKFIYDIGPSRQVFNLCSTRYALGLYDILLRVLTGGIFFSCWDRTKVSSDDKYL